MADVKLNENQTKVLDMVSSMTVLELADLIKAMEEKFGVSAAAPASVAAAPAAAGEPVEEKSNFDVMLDDAGSNKIAVIKAVKDLLGLGLTEAKDLVDKAPSKILENAEKKVAEEALAKLTEAGAKASLK